MGWDLSGEGSGLFGVSFFLKENIGFNFERKNNWESGFDAMYTLMNVFALFSLPPSKELWEPVYKIKWVCPGQTLAP